MLDMRKQKDRFEDAATVARKIGVCDRTIRRWHDAGLVRRKEVRQGMTLRCLYSLMDARRVAAGRAG